MNDLAFSKPYDEFFVVSCGDDKLIQVSYIVIKQLILVIKMNPHFEIFSQGLGCSDWS